MLAVCSCKSTRLKDCGLSAQLERHFSACHVLQIVNALTRRPASAARTEPPPACWRMRGMNTAARGQAGLLPAEGPCGTVGVEEPNVYAADRSDAAAAGNQLRSEVVSGATYIGNAALRERRTRNDRGMTKLIIDLGHRAER